MTENREYSPATLCAALSVGLIVITGVLTYLFVEPLSIAVAFHVGMIVVYLGLLVLFGLGSAVESAILVVVCAVLLAFAHPAYRDYLDRKAELERAKSDESVDANKTIPASDLSI